MNPLKTRLVSAARRSAVSLLCLKKGGGLYFSDEETLALALAHLIVGPQHDYPGL